jgi:peptidoglycan/LPS O-acetylase OafA/YrhL
MQSARDQIDSLTGLRAAVAIWVVLMHFREVTPTRVWEFPIGDALIANGAFGVDIFFVLSGFILSHVYVKTFHSRLRANQYFRFLMFRLARIYPVHLVTFVAMLALAGVKVMISGSDGLPGRYDPATIITTLTLTHSWFPGIQSPNMPSWSISAEWFAYLAFPTLCILLPRNKWVPALYIGAALALVFFEPFGHYSLSHALAAFLVGMVAFHSALPAAGRIRFGRLTGLCVAGMIVFWAQGPNPRNEIGLLLSAALIVALVDSQDFLSQVLSSRLVVYLGEISYSLYMVHWPVRVAIRSALQMLGLLDSLPSAIVVSGYVIAALLGAIASYHFIEVPGRTLLRTAANAFGQRLASAANVGRG